VLASILSRFWRRDDPGARFADQWVGRGLDALAEGDAAAARAAFESALACDSRHLAAMVNLGHVLREHSGDYLLAATHYEAALKRDATLDDVRVQLGSCAYELGDAPAALRWFEEVLARDPGHIDAAQHALFVMNALPGLTSEQMFLAHRRWARRHADPIARLPRRVPQNGNGRIRLAYLSGDFRDHATLAFIEHLLANHDRTHFDVSCYSSSLVRDSATRRLGVLVTQWHDVHAMDDASVAARIRNDGVDVLVDLSGHTRDNRLGVLARKPAPVQISWLGYLRTTGLAAIDHRFSDAAADPLGLSDAVHSERVVRLPGALWAFSPHADAPAPAPRAPDARISFGSFNHPAKLSDPVLALWAALLQRVPSSKLVLAGVPAGPGRERIAAAMKKGGVDPVRLKFHARLPRHEFWQLIADTDVALDPFPYNGGATTCDCLWQGVPVVTLAGDHGFARSGVTVLTSAGFAEWIAGSSEDYISKAAALAQDRAALAGLRHSMRQRLGASELCDLPGFARRFENAITLLWQDACI
jgi:predicted O-linked N-acetylglucosamine transferase (SPINDLY family)